MYMHPTIFTFSYMGYKVSRKIKKETEMKIKNVDDDFKAFNYICNHVNKIRTNLRKEIRKSRHHVIIMAFR